MPPRIFTLVIVAFWLAMAALFSVTEIWPRLSPAEPLMFPVDVVDEAGQSRDLVNYYVSKNGVLNYRADVELSYHHEDDSFESECQLEKSFFDVKEAKRDQGPALLPQVHEVKMTSVYRLTRDAEMRRIDVRTKYVLAVGNDDENAYKVEAHITGTPQARQFVPHLELTFPELKPDAQIGPFTPRDFQQDADPVAVLPRGTVLNPLHPPRRFTDLAEGQRWRFTFIDPLALLGLVAPLDAANGGALRNAGIGTGVSVLDAEVQRGVQTMTWDEGKDVLCRIIECEGDGPVGPMTIWVRERDGVVMRQEFRLWGDSWSLLRLPRAYKMRAPTSQRKLP
jgi:hypothetical protein